LLRNPNNSNLSDNIFFSKEEQTRPRYTGKKVGRNSKCPCGSELKYAKCCGNPALKNVTLDGLKDKYGDISDDD